MKAKTIATTTIAVLALSGAGAAQASNPTGYTPTAAAVKNWVKSWCRVKPGITRAAAIRIMGPPTDEWKLGEKSLVGPITDPQMSWHAYQYDFTVFFDLGNRIGTAQVQPIGLTSADRRAIRCVENRFAR